MRRQGIPRPVEVAISLVILTAVAPLLLVAAALVAASSPGPILFRHWRVGLGGKPFAMLKLRTMRVEDGPEVTAACDPRVTPIGRVLRKTKLDELPELWNVVRGDMALVGPRPESRRYAVAARPEWQDVLSVRPGVTDPMTLQLRNEEELLEASGSDYEVFYRRYLLPYKLRGYHEYLASRTWKRDVAVLAMTLLVVVWPRVRPAPSPREIVAAVRQARSAPRADESSLRRTP